MRRTTGALAAACAILGFGLLTSGAAKADPVPAFKGNDTGGIISFSVYKADEMKQMAVDHCAQYGKVVKLTGVQATYGGYLSFACVWVPVAHREPALSVRY